MAQLTNLQDDILLFNDAGLHVDARQVSIGIVVWDSLGNRFMLMDLQSSL